MWKVTWQSLPDAENVRKMQVSPSLRKHKKRLNEKSERQGWHSAHQPS